MEDILMLVLFLFCTNMDAIVRGELCQDETNTLTCRQEIPVILPDNVTSVLLEGLDFSEYMHEHPFHHASWRQVQSLVLTDATVDIDTLVRRNDYVIKKGLFKNLVNLKHLKIESMKYTQTEQDGYSGLDNLESLDLSGCIRHSLTVITRGLGDIQMPKLKVLRLKGISSHTSYPPIFDESFFYSLKNKPIAELDLSYTKAKAMDATSLAFSLPNLRTFNIEHGGYLFYHLVLAIVVNPRGPTFSNIENLNANYAEYPDSVYNKIEMFSQIDNINSMPPMNNFRVLSVRRVIPKGEIVDFTFQKIGDRICPTMSFRTRKDIKWVPPICLHGANYDNVSLEYFDFADNGVASIGPNFFEFSRNFKVIDFSMNELGDNINVISHAPNNSINVIKLYLSYNGIKNLDKELLFVKPKVILLDLSHNLLEHLSLFIPESHPLKFLNLSYNRITFIDPALLSKLDNQLFTKYRNVYRTTENDTLSNLSINVSGNRFQCTCVYKGLIEDILTSSVLIKNEALTCIHEDNVIPIDESVLPKIKHLCRWPKIRILIIVSSVIFIVILIIAMVVIVRRYRTRKQNRHFKHIVGQFNNDPDKPDYPVFLSFASKDQDIVHKYILPRLNKGLQDILETEEVCVATGDLNFLPGFNISGEIIRCVEASRVVIFCVSREFCESGYCKNELQVADYTQTPVILLFLEEIEVIQMSKLLQKYFYTTTRCKVTMYNDRRVLIPNWNTLCRSIVQLFDVQDS